MSMIMSMSLLPSTALSTRGRNKCGAGLAAGGSAGAAAGARMPEEVAAVCSASAAAQSSAASARPSAWVDCVCAACSDSAAAQSSSRFCPVSSSLSRSFSESVIFQCSGDICFRGRQHPLHAQCVSLVVGAIAAFHDGNAADTGGHGGGNGNGQDVVDFQLDQFGNGGVDLPE